MFKNLSKIIFMFMIWLGTSMIISSNSWLSLWMGLEINLLAFIPILINCNNIYNTEAALNYFLVQAFASTTLLFAMMFMIIMNNYLFMNMYMNFDMSSKLIIISLMMKLGAPPFHFWFPNVMENIDWNNGLIMMTWQKIGPMLIISFMMKCNLIFITFIIFSTLIGAIGGLNQNSLRKLMAFSSINHLGWMFSAILYNENIWIIYFMIYSFLVLCVIYMMKMMKIFYMNQLYMIYFNNPIMKFMLLITLLSLGGLPPFLGFFPKWIIIQSLNYMNMNLISLFLICMSLFTLFYYLKMCMSAFLFNYKQLNIKWELLSNNLKLFNLLMINLFSLIGFLLMIELLFYL